MSLAGIFLLFFKANIFRKLQPVLISFAIGTLLGGAFLHLIPESMAHGDFHGHSDKSPILIIISIVLFYIIEKYLHIHHHSQNGTKEIKAFGPLNLMADAFHNFLDGVLIAAAYKADVSTGVVATIAVIAHELPQEIGDFAVLVQAGYTRRKALIFNFLTALTAFLGASLVILFPNHSNEFSQYILPLAAGGFIYIALADLVPELNFKKSVKASIVEGIVLIFGLLLMWFLSNLHLMHH